MTQHIFRTIDAARCDLTFFPTAKSLICKPIYLAMKLLEQYFKESYQLIPLSRCRNSGVALVPTLGLNF
jgi:hypothetical protein